ncbi:2-keto-4-pentenoate hydratase/2-oxohepta-3-ene-1,7-dioic acid hydratase (catechol pathway) [Rhizobiales bacterium GAS188]|nr:2-keto-4-pentenoate hydratase/2-oxohepta-3-ene-1,7-dioic acid hydratase (catechol pathway) [Rhizobiales bacterium GAS188]
MRYISFMAEGRSSFGISRPDGVFDLGVRLSPHVPDLKAYLDLTSQGFSLGREASSTDYAHGEFAYAPVIANPAKILCVGLNYEEHRKETGRPEAAYPSIFTRFADSLIGHEAPIHLPPVSSALDYEGELAVVIGRPGFRVPRDKALGLVAGFSCFNDATLRDWQRHTHQFTPGKNFPATGGFGPELVTPDEVGRLEERAIETRLNATVVQKATLGDMIFPIDAIIAYVSGFTRLAPGDVIATGTPGGVGFKREPQLFMKAGDVVEVTIAGIGHLRNEVAAEPASGA